MTLRLTREEGDWLRAVLALYRAERARALRRAETGTRSPHERTDAARWRRDVDVAMALMCAIDEGMRRGRT